MRIALTVEDFRPWRGGGEGYVFNLARALLAKGHEIHVFAACIGEVPDGMVRHPVPLRSLLPRRTAFAVGCARALDRSPIHFDLVHGFGKSIRMDVFRPGGGVHRAWQEHDIRSVEGRGRRWWRRVRRALSLDQWLVLRLEARQFLPGPGGPEIIVNSNMVRKHILSHYSVDADRIHVIYNGVDTARFSPTRREEFRDEMRREWAAAPSDVVLLFAANNFRLKGLIPLIRAVAELDRDREWFRVVVMGRGRPMLYRRLARRLGCDRQIVFLGPVREPERAYAAADVLVHPTFYDPCANVTMEALASGLPVITSVYNGAGELITTGAEGFVTDPEDTRGLAEAIGVFLDEARRKAGGEAARRLAEQHDMGRHVEEVLAVYERTLARKRAET